MSYSRAWDANVPPPHPDSYRALPEPVQAELLAWIERHVGTERYVGRVEIDLIDCPLLRVWSIDKQRLYNVPWTGDEFPWEVGEVPMREPAPASAMEQW